MLGNSDDIALPLRALNPQGKQHLNLRLDEMIAFGAEEVAAKTVQEAAERLGWIPNRFQVGLIIVDDADGSWSNRYITDYRHRFQHQNEVKRDWATALCWTSETWTPEAIRQEVLLVIYRTIFACLNGVAISLQDKLKQEGLASVFAGKHYPALSPAQTVRVKELIHQHKNTTDDDLAFAYLYGDSVAKAAGRKPAGLPDNAGLCYAHHQVLELGIKPEQLIRNALV